jgi:hypothetical protein
MQPEAWQIHVGRHNSGIKASPECPAAFGVFDHHAVSVIELVKAL